MFLLKKSAALITAGDVVFEGGKIAHELFDCTVLAGKEEVDKTPCLSRANAWEFRKNLDKSLNRVHIYEVTNRLRIVANKGNKF